MSTVVTFPAGTCKARAASWVALAASGLTFASVFCRPATSAGAEPDIRLPVTESDYKRTRDYIEETPDPDYHHAPPEAVEAFRDIKYGVRIHWGLYSIIGKGNESWPFLNMSFEQKQAYEQMYKTWNPTGFDAREWMKLFKDNGARMVAFTTKHHEGFSMFDTRTRVRRRVNWTADGGPALEDCDLAYGVMDTPFHRDVVKEVCDAARENGLKIDLYFSHPDWYDADFRPYGWSPAVTPDALAHPDLYGNALVTGRKTRFYFTAPDVTPEEQARMVDRHRAQLVELLSNYGKIDMVCLDIFLGKKVWPQTRDTIKLLRKLQPDVMFRARGVGNYGDYYTPERFVPSGKENTDMPWFVIYPLGGSFSYEADAAKYKGGRWIIRNLVDAVAKGGNFMVGVGPDGDGRFHPRAVENLQEAGAWLKVNGEAIYATRARAGDHWKEGADVRFTRSKDGRTVYAICLKWPGKQLTLATVHPKAGSDVVMLGQPGPLPWTYADGTGMTVQLPDEPKGEKDAPLAYAFKITPETPETPETAGKPE